MMAAGGATSFLFHSFQVAEEDSTKGRLFRYAGILSHHAEIGPKLPDSTSDSSAITDKIMHALHTLITKAAGYVSLCGPLNSAYQIMRR